MEKNRIKAFAAAALLAGNIALAHYSLSIDLDDYSDKQIEAEYQKRVEERKKDNVGKMVIFEPGEHCFKVVHVLHMNEHIERGTIDCPDGYEIVAAYAYYDTGYTVEAIYYVNYETVEAVLDENGNCSSFGTPIEVSNENEESKVLVR